MTDLKLLEPKPQLLLEKGKFREEKIKKDNHTDFNFSHYVLFFIFFFAPFFVTYIFTHARVQNDKPVSLDDEIGGLEKIMDAKDLSDLYKNNSLDISLSGSSALNIRILGYHQIRYVKDTDSQKAKLFITSPDNFEKEMKYLYDNGYHSVYLSDYLNFLKNNNVNKLSEKSFVLTFDDGYSSQYKNAFSILKKYNFVGTFFIYSGCVDRYPICMTSENLKDLANANMKIANHTSDHFYLPKYNNDIIKNEITENNKVLINLVGSSSVENTFAYPYGASDERVRGIVRDLGYDGAVGVLPEKNSTTTDIYNLRRYLLGNDFEYFLYLFK